MNGPERPNGVGSDIHVPIEQLDDAGDDVLYIRIRLALSRRGGLQNGRRSVLAIDRSSVSLDELVFVDLSPADSVPVGSTLQPSDGAPTRVLVSAEPLVLPPTWIRLSWVLCC